MIRFMFCNNYVLTVTSNLIELTELFLVYIRVLNFTLLTAFKKTLFAKSLISPLLPVKHPLRMYFSIQDIRVIASYFIL